MTFDRVFLDTAYVLARVNAHDKYHAAAESCASGLRSAREVWTTEAVLTEVANGLSMTHRREAVRFISACQSTPNIRIVSVDSALFQAGLALYSSRPDKQWGLTDCISFAVMQERGLSEALTSDHHFRQAGYRALLL